MKKFFYAILLLCLLFGLTACGGEKTLEVNVEQLLSDMAAKVQWKDMMTMSSKHLKNLYGIAEGDVVKFSGVMKNDGITADEILLIEAENETKADALKEKLQARLKNKANEAKDYLPEQYAVIDKAEIMQEGKYLALLVSPDVTALSELWKEAMKD
ncbi:MAG TPA: DUF4358 domain-containing protein [Bacillota bacterium]|nr:DUF4358 domain-containing protein [Bacillota bacterium]